MLPAVFDPGELRRQYRAFLDELLSVSRTDPAMTAGGARPPWAKPLFDYPFELPAELAGDPHYFAVRDLLDALAARYAAFPESVSVAQEVLRDAFRSNGGDWRTQKTTDDPSRGRQPGWTSAKPPVRDSEPTATGAVPPEELLLSVPVPSAHTRSPSPPQQQQQQPAPELPETRFLNAGIAGHNRNDPLKLGKVYSLEIGVDLIKGGASGLEFGTRLPDAAVLFTPEQSAVELTIQVSGDGFDVMPTTETLSLPRRGPSANRLEIAVVPRRAGRCMLTVTVHKAGNYLLEMEISYSVGVQDPLPATQQSFGRPMGAAQQLKPREIGLGFRKVVNGYECTFRDAAFNTAILPHTDVQLADIMATARKALMSVVSHINGDNKRIFQTSITIDNDSRDVALATLARAGATLFNRLFFGPLASDDLKRIGNAIKTRALDPTRVLHVQIVSHELPIPWAMMYFGEVRAGSTLSWDNFLGMRHVIEQLPRQVNLSVDDERIVSNVPALAVSVNVNTGIDRQMKSDFVESQLTQWKGRAGALGGAIDVVTRSTREEVLAALGAPANDQLMYLYCHAVTSGVLDAGGIEASLLELSNGSIKLGDLYIEAPMDVPLPGHPLIFLNACESAELTPAFYDGFVPYFLGKGARGVIGTECKMPALYAAAFAEAFFPEFLAGKPLGQLMLELTRKFLDTHGNPLGLLYTVYCDADTQVAPGLHS